MFRWTRRPSLGGDRAADLVALDDALDALARLDARKAQVVEMRFFGGLSVEETAEVLKVSSVTVMRDWSTAKAWLYLGTDRREEQWTRDRWKQVDSISASRAGASATEARCLSAATPAAVTRKLEQEVRSLLVAQQEAGAFEEKTAIEIAARALALGQDQEDTRQLQFRHRPELSPITALSKSSAAAGWASCTRPRTPNFAASLPLSSCPRASHRTRKH